MIERSWPAVTFCMTSMSMKTLPAGSFSLPAISLRRSARAFASSNLGFAGLAAGPAGSSRTAAVWACSGCRPAAAMAAADTSSRVGPKRTEKGVAMGFVSRSVARRLPDDGISRPARGSRAGEGSGVLDGGESGALGVEVALGGSGPGVGHGGHHLRIGEAGGEHPEVPVDGAAVQDLEQHLEVGAGEEPEGAGVGGQGEGVAGAAGAVGQDVLGADGEAAGLEAEPGVARRARGLGGRTLPAELHHLEVAGREAAEGPVERVIVPARVVGALGQ